MSKFKIGERVVFKRTGKEYIVDGFSCCQGCGEPTIHCRGHNYILHQPCDDCGHINYDVRYQGYERNFEKLISVAACIEYKLSVSLPELTKIKELQNQ